MAFQPIFMKNVDLVIGDATESRNFKCQVKSLKFVPDTNIVREKTACPNGQYSEVEDPEWTLEIGHLGGRDPEDAEAALTEFLRVHAGEKMPVAVRFWSGDHLGGYKAMVTLTPTAISGEMGQFSNESTQLPVEGQIEPLTELETDEMAPAVFS